ncbi:MAG: RpiB/LacA/LacB family sugar-phosphate isomerase [Bacteroidales bacterium]|jgi:ribose 5-phosphate isomerase B|nr:RpiB/LacA/LacB family sugar-phosphate isomerase [Bacteroidales bacterium]
MRTLLIAGDHAGFDTKEFIKQSLEEQQYTIIDFGAFSDERMDYPDVVHPLAREINAGVYSTGIILCGSGNGVNMTANKYPNVRSALCWTKEIASLARKHNNANVIAIPARFVDKQTAWDIVITFLSTDFEEGRHCQRVNKITTGIQL